MPYTREYPSAEYLLSTFTYSGTLGSPLTWKSPRPKIVVGQIAGGPDSNGYWVVKLDRTRTLESGYCGGSPGKVQAMQSQDLAV
jgi:hypothetical protein